MLALRTVVIFLSENALALTLCRHTTGTGQSEQHGVRERFCGDNLWSSEFLKIKQDGLVVSESNSTYGRVVF